MKKSTSIILTPGQLKRLQKMSKEDHRSQSEIVRAALELYFKQSDECNAAVAWMDKMSRIAKADAAAKKDS